MTSKKVAVIGAGAAGLIAAGTAARLGASVTLIEKNQRVGRKIMITGKGRCNILNNCDVPTFINNVPVNGRFLYSAVNGFSPYDTYEFFEEIGVPLKTERGNRCYPQSDKAVDVVDALRRFVLDSGVTIVNDTAKSLETENGEAVGVRCEKQTYYADSVIICCGGMSYPLTGSTGDGYTLARQAGHTIVEPKPSLVPIESSDPECKSMQGLSLRNAALKIIDKQTDKTVYSDFGEMLFTHFGISGPMVLSASSHLRKIEQGRYTASIDLKPALDEKKLDTRILRDLNANGKAKLKALFREWLPMQMIPVFISLAKLDGEKLASQLSGDERRRIVALMKDFAFDIVGHRDFNEAIITRGGVSVDEINQKTMESKLVKGLFFAGEVLDVDANTGGYNLQIAFSTGWLAGENQ